MRAGAGATTAVTRRDTPELALGNSYEPGRIAGGVINRLHLVWRDALGLIYALRGPRTGAQTKLLALVALAYALLPLDLLPDVAPLLGVADDLLVVPALLALATRTLPAPVRAAAVSRSAGIQKRLPWMVTEGMALSVLAFGGLVWGLLQLFGVI